MFKCFPHFHQECSDNELHHLKKDISSPNCYICDSFNKFPDFFYTGI